MSYLFDVVRSISVARARGIGHCIHMTLHPEIITFESFADSSGAPAVVEVRAGRQTARFALDMLGGVTCNGLGSGLTARMTARAADAARRLYLARVGELGAEWLAANAAIYTE